MSHLKIKDIINESYELLTESKTLNNDFVGCYATDLLSQAIQGAKSDQILITMISNPNTVGVAIMMDLSCIIISCGKDVSQVMINKANEENIAIIKTKKHTHQVIIDLFQRGLL